MFEMMIRHLDNQNRFTLPKKVREDWEKKSLENGRVRVHPVRGAVYLTTLEDETEFKQILASQNDTCSEWVGESLDCELDLRGRIKMPRALMPLIPFPGKDLWVFVYGHVLKVVAHNLKKTYIREPDQAALKQADQTRVYREKIRSNLNGLLDMVRVGSEKERIREALTGIFENRLSVMMTILDLMGQKGFILGLKNKPNGSYVYLLLDPLEGTFALYDLVEYIGFIKEKKSSVISKIHVRQAIRTDEPAFEQDVLTVELDKADTRILGQSMSVAEAGLFSENLS